MCWVHVCVGFVASQADRYRTVHSFLGLSPIIPYNLSPRSCLRRSVVLRRCSPSSLYLPSGTPHTCIGLPAATSSPPINMNISTKLSLALSGLLLVVAVSSGFQPAHNNLVRPTAASIVRRTTPAHTTQLNEKAGRPEFEVGDEEYSGDIDWDGEWAKVVKESDKKDRPGKDFYKSDAERATIKAVNKAAEQVAKVKVQAPSFKPPPIRSLQGDWRVSSISMHTLRSCTG